MRKRKTFLRVCHICGLEELVRSDQKNCKCRKCCTKELSRRFKNWISENRSVFLKHCGEANRKHGLWKSRIYRIHKSMLDRCGYRSTRHKWAKYYEDKGIRVCEEWLNFEVFAAWAFANGYSDDLTIDRIDGNKNYEPSNCRWATRKEQQSHRSNSRSTRWSEVSPTCLMCGKSERKHSSKGLCTACVQIAWRKKRKQEQQKP